ncbi:hypothetical protein JJB11_21420 [Ramlibacter ginsenosidimutans]|uniref:Uncharacterized protein n=1 Tax=Ramlibacter ginsenosidimutans TaxID=502333 RepID=A0A934TW32_9BURK|nr:hypothetical protein [Ramlibacter ginsenosidimutans]MBK6008669.1 hypothetical protein [Ramlibacter ginsenosidimutans]
MADDRSPAERTLSAQLESPAFLIGVEQGRWFVQKFEFPHLYVRIHAVQGGSSFGHEFHLLCDGYPLPGPFVERWDFVQGRRPAAPSGHCFSPAFIDALKDWEQYPGQHGGIYRGWQRVAADHGGRPWTEVRPDWAWNAQRNITFIMEHLFDVVDEQASYLARKTES